MLHHSDIAPLLFSCSFLVQKGTLPMTVHILVDGENLRFVNLSRINGYGEHLVETNARLDTNGKDVSIKLLEMRDNGKSKSFSLSADELDVLFEAVNDYKAFLVAKKEQEERKAAEKLERLHE